MISRLEEMRRRSDVSQDHHRLTYRIAFFLLHGKGQREAALERMLSLIQLRKNVKASQIVNIFKTPHERLEPMMDCS